MSQNGGLAVGIIAVLTVLGVTNMSNRTPESTAQEPAKRSAVLTGNTKESSPGNVQIACEEIVKRLRRYVQNSVQEWELPPSCYTERKPEGAKTVHAADEVRFAIAIVPNPVSTHLALLFDRLVDSIRQSAQDQGYMYDASWFPWELSGKTYELLADQKAAEQQVTNEQVQPGIMLFRSGITDVKRDPYAAGLIVLLVGEQPTGGISDDQFGHALDWIQQLRSSSDSVLRILGPTFSGSLPSLKRAIQARKREDFSKYLVFSGTVSSADDYKPFQSWIADLPNRSRFDTAMADDSRMTEDFCNYLAAQGYSGPVAFLSEDETAFGNQPNICPNSLNYHYPRDIAMLRSAYQQQSILTPSKAGQNTDSHSTELRVDLSEPAGSDHDTVRSYAEQLRPLDEESILLGIANRLREHRVQFVIIRSTNSLDQIFLTQFLRRAYADGRIVIDGADLLFTRGEVGKSLRGVMLLSSYPLLTEPVYDDKLGSKDSRIYGNVFSEDTARGVYVAWRRLFDPSLNVCAKPDTTSATPDDNRPPTWVTVIGRRKFWPIAELANSTGGPVRTHLRLPMGTWMFLLACIFWSAAHLYFCWTGSIIGTLRARTYFAPLPRWEHPALIALGSLIPATLAIVIAAASGLFAFLGGKRPFENELTGILLLIFVVAILSTVVLACTMNYRLIPVQASTSLSNRRWQIKAGAIACALLAVFAVLEIILQLFIFTDANRVPAYWRNVHLTSGVSGLVPQIILLAGAYLWFWFTLRGLAHFGEDRPRLPAKGDLPKPMVMFSDDAAKRIEDAASPLKNVYTLIVTFAITGVVSLLALDTNLIRTLGELFFGKLMFVWLCFYIAVILTGAVHLWISWQELRQLLIYLDRLPLRRTLRALKGLAWGSIWKMCGNVLQERYRAISFQIESFRHLKNAATEWVPENVQGDEHRATMLDEFQRFETEIAEFATWFGKLNRNQHVEDIGELQRFQTNVPRIGALVLNNILIPEWRKETKSLIFERRPTGDKDGGASADFDFPTDELKPIVRAAEEFFVLPYLAFIQNILGRMRTIAFGTIWLFVSITLAVASYPFEPLSVLGAIFLTVFVVVGGVMILVYSQMARDATLSHVTNTRPGQLGLDFWTRLVEFGVGPVIGLLTTLFPSIADFLFSWFEPSVQALK